MIRNIWTSIFVCKLYSSLKFFFFIGIMYVLILLINFRWVNHKTRKMRISMISAETPITPNKCHLVKITFTYCEITTIKITFRIEFHSNFNWAWNRHAIQIILLVLQRNSTHNVWIWIISKGLAHFDFQSRWSVLNCCRINQCF